MKKQVARVLSLEEKLISRACSEMQFRRGRGAIVIKSQAVLGPVSVRADHCHEFSPVCKVSCPVILECREETLDEVYFTNAEVAKITGKIVVI